MLQELVKTVIDSFVAPRAAARRVIDNVQDFQGVAIIFGLGFTLSAMILIVKTAIGSNATVNIDAAGARIALHFQQPDLQRCHFRLSLHRRVWHWQTIRRRWIFT